MANDLVSRRAFLGVAALGVAGLGMSARGQVAPAAGPAGQPVKKLGFALVGIGSLSMGQILPAFAKCQFAKPVALLVSGHADKAAAQAAKYGIDAKNIYSYENFDTIKNNPDVDVVYVVLPNSMHKEYTIRAAKAGKHVLCEKPMAVSVAECEAMIEACAEAKRKLMIGYRLHYEPMTQRAIELAQSANDIGVIKQISGESGFNVGDPTQWRLNKKLAGGGSMMDMGIYAINAIRYLSGQEPAEVTAYATTTPNDVRFKEVEETMQLSMTFASGMVATVLTTYGFGCNRFRVYGTKGILESEPIQAYSGNKLWITRGRAGKEEQMYTPVNHFAAEMDHMCACIVNDKAILTPGEEGLKDMKVMMAAYDAVAGGKAVKIV